MTDLTIEDAFSMLKNNISMLSDELSFDRIELLRAFLIRALEEHERVVKDADAMRYTLEKASEANASLQRDASIRTEKLVNTIRWLEENQPDVFKRGLWEAIDAQITKEQS